eukprot:tig00000215_g18562.t1
MADDEWVRFTRVSAEAPEGVELQGAAFAFKNESNGHATIGIVGGRTRDLRLLDVQTQEWRIRRQKKRQAPEADGEGSAAAAAPPPPASDWPPALDHATVVVHACPEPVGPCAFLYGGVGEDTKLGDVWRLSLRTLQWTRVYQHHERAAAAGAGGAAPAPEGRSRQPAAPPRARARARR